MAHVTLQLGTGLTIPFRAVRTKGRRSVSVRAVAWRRRALREAHTTVCNDIPLCHADQPIFNPREGTRRSRRLGMSLVMAALLAGCARVYPVPTDVAVPGMSNPELALRQSMNTVAAEMAELGHIGPGRTQEAEPVAPEDLQHVVSFQWNGPLDQGVAKLAQSVGYTFTLTVPAGVQPLTVSINASSQPAYEVFRSLGEQAGNKATVQVDILHHQVEVIYHA